MTEKQLEAWKEDAADTLSKIDYEKRTKDNFLLAGASLAILATGKKDNMHDEISDAKKYLNLLKETGIKGYRRLALDELAHFKFLYDLSDIKPSDLYSEYEYLLSTLDKSDEDVSNQNQRFEIINFVPDSEIDRLKQESLLSFIQYMDEKGLEQTTNDRYHDTKAEQALKKMLSIDYEILEIMLQSADEREKYIIRDMYKKMDKL